MLRESAFDGRGGPLVADGCGNASVFARYCCLFFKLCSLAAERRAHWVLTPIRYWLDGFRVLQTRAACPELGRCCIYSAGRLHSHARVQHRCPAALRSLTGYKEQAIRRNATPRALPRIIGNSAGSPAATASHGTTCQGRRPRRRRAR